MAKISATSVDNIIKASKSALAAGREKGDISDLSNAEWEIIGAELVVPMDGKPYGIIILNGVDGVYFTSSKITKIVRAMYKLGDYMTLDIDDNGVIHDTMMISVGGAEVFTAADGKEITYYPIEPIDYKN